jgi:hypothetical protein
MHTCKLVQINPNALKYTTIQTHPRYGKVESIPLSIPVLKAVAFAFNVAWVTPNVILDPGRDAVL